MVTHKMRENAHKITFLVEQYPEHTTTQIISLLELPAIDINAAFWTAQELGFLSEPEDDNVKLLKRPRDWHFGDAQRDLQHEILYIFEQLAKKETDLEENFISQWTQGYPAHDVMISLKQLVNEKKLGQYTLEDQRIDEKAEPVFNEDGKPEMDEYVFFSLYENSEQMWGIKQFKKPPKLPGDKVE